MVSTRKFDQFIFIVIAKRNSFNQLIFHFLLTNFEEERKGQQHHDMLTSSYFLPTTTLLCFYFRTLLKSNMNVLGRKGSLIFL